MISRQLKIIAKELNVPVIALSQLNRSLEQRENKKPMLSDLRESGAIEQDADMVIFIHRPERVGIRVDDEGNSLKGIAEIIIAKHRNGAVGDIRLRFVEELAFFRNLERTSPFYSASPAIARGRRGAGKGAEKTTKKIPSRMNEEIPLDAIYRPDTDFEARESDDI